MLNWIYNKICICIWNHDVGLKIIIYYHHHKKVANEQFSICFFLITHLNSHIFIELNIQYTWIGHNINDINRKEFIVIIEIIEIVVIVWNDFLQIFAICYEFRSMKHICSHSFNIEWIFWTENQFQYTLIEYWWISYSKNTLHSQQSFLK